ncbi:hypothetical protein LTR36_008787 [Oleoguttula mirabilis]|uniref:Uncharacterized protein n=1 Tax=Oleoguttula mirabilis TaxID=1507867 RepID=A0AAV9J747_9PEZI|nr:hypothetical protein LTR36_008787 [Oleoguttula mirabilis]
MGVQDPNGVPAYSGHGYSGPMHTQHSNPYQSQSWYTQPASAYPAPSQSTSRKRKAGLTAQSAVIDLTQDTPPKKRKTKKSRPVEADDSAKLTKKAKKPKDEEKRLRRWRTHAPTSYQEVRDRALTQRMFALDRQRDTSNPDHPTETVSLAGTTGNVYTVVIDKVPSCDCPHAKKGNQCKHIAYVLSRVLRAPPNLEYQLAFVSSELREIFAKAPPLPSETAAEASNKQDGNRKPVEDECPICCMDFEPESGEAIVYCKAACGNNIHKTCFQQWAATKRGGQVTCPFCRAPWEGDEETVKQVAKSGPMNGEGYVNVASQLGLSGRRDYSTYHSHWVRRQAMRGDISWDEDGVMDHEY